MGGHKTTSGFLIEKTFARMYREFLAGRARGWPQLLNRGPYSTPRTDLGPEQMSRQYRGLQREPLQGWIEVLRGSGVVEPADQELEASLFLTDLERAGKAADDIIFSLADARELLGKILPPVEREIVWARCMEAGDESPAGTVLLGCEPSMFYPPTCDSAIVDGMFFTFPTALDEDGLRLRAYHEKLNRWGLFDTPSDAEQYLQVYLSSLPLDWDQHCYRYHSVEVRVVLHPRQFAILPTPQS